MNQQVDCMIDMMMLVTHMSEPALLESRKPRAGGPGCTRAAARPTHRTAENQNYRRTELELEPTRMKVLALLLVLEGSRTRPC